MVSLNRLLVRWRYTLTCAALTLTFIIHPLIRHCPIACLLLWLLSVLQRLLLASTQLVLIHVVMSNSSTLLALVGRDCLVFGFGIFGVFGDDPPGVEKAGYVAEAAESEVYEGIGRADGAFDPDCEIVNVNEERRGGLGVEGM